MNSPTTSSPTITPHCLPRSPRPRVVRGRSSTRPPVRRSASRRCTRWRTSNARSTPRRRRSPPGPRSATSERSELLLRAADAIDANAEALAQLLSREQGKPLNGPNARFEVGGCVGLAARGRSDPARAPRSSSTTATTHAELHYRPIGVVGAIGPWNWPMMITVWQIAPALRMGNTVVVKPSEYTPLSVLALVAVINEVLPDGVLNIVAGGRDVGAALSSHPAVGKVMFTGSTATGKAIIRSSADTVKRLTLELGGNDAGIVLPDVDPKAIAEGLFWGAFINTGPDLRGPQAPLRARRRLRRGRATRSSHVAARDADGRRHSTSRTCSARCRTARSTTSSTASSRPRRRRAPASCSAANPTATSPGTSTRPP